MISCQRRSAECWVTLRVVLPSTDLSSHSPVNAPLPATVQTFFRPMAPIFIPTLIQLLSIVIVASLLLLLLARIEP